MAEFDDALTAARDLEVQLAAARTSATADDERMARLQAARQAAVRSVDPRDPRGTARVAAFDDEIAAVEKSLSANRALVTGLRRDHRDAIGAFGRLANPEEEAARLSGDTPLLLMPVRMETRFIGDALCVRIYPDHWAVDAFEDRLSEVEVDSARRFWEGWWRAGGDEGRRRGAWRGLVASHGSGRGGWIIRNYRPTNLFEEPERSFANEVILVISAR